MNNRNEFPKIKAGDLIECANGNIYIYINNNIFIGGASVGKVDGYIDAIFSKGGCVGYPSFDIVRIWRVSFGDRGCLYRPCNWNEYKQLNPLWELKEVKETLQIGEFTYDKSQVEEALKNIKPIV